MNCDYCGEPGALAAADTVEALRGKKVCLKCWLLDRFEGPAPRRPAEAPA